MYFVAKPNEEAKAFIQAAGLIDETQMKAVGTLVFDLKNYNLWDKMKAIYPFVGQAGVSSSFQFNLKDPRNLNAAYRLSFVGSWAYSPSLGIIPDGSTTYANTFFDPSSSLSLTDNHLSYYLTQNNLAITNGSMGSKDVYMLQVVGYGFTRNASSNSTFKSGLSTNSGFWLGTRTAINRTVLFNNTQNLVENTNTTSFFMPSYVTIGATNDGGTGTPSPTVRSSGSIGFASIGDGLTDTEAANLYTAVQRFQTTLGRQV